MIYSLLAKQFIRSRVAITGLSFLLLAGIISIFIGRSFIVRQQQSIAATQAYQQQHIQRTVEFANKDMGLLLYYLRFGYVNKLQPLNGLAVGQRDVNLGIQQVSIRTLEEKKYDTDLVNPVSLVVGNFDFSFVLIYLFPLFIIAFCYNILSGEKEEGTWRLLNVQSPNAKKIILQKLQVRFLFVLAVLLLLNIIAVIVLHIPVDGPFIGILTASTAYILFWFALCGWIISWHKNSNVNAASLLSSWLFLTILAPAIVNNFIITRYPVPEALHTIVANRDGYHKKWDEAKEPTMQKFYAHYPQLAHYGVPGKEFSWLWYYAMQQMGDDEAKQYSTAMRDKLLQRERISNSIGYFLPSVHIQLQLNKLTRSGLSNQVAFLDSLTAFHEKKRLYFYPKIFEETPVNSEDWTAHRVEFFNETTSVNWLLLLLPFFMAIALLAGLMQFNFRRQLEI